MLSAIAARKAAQAASRQTSGTPLEIVEPANTVQSLPPSNPSSKRKPSSQKAPNPTKRKKKGKDKEKRVKETRYFQQPQQDLFEVQEDVIAIDSDEQGDSAMSEDQESYETPAILAPLTNKRRWSPSRALDSSDEEKVEDGEEREDVIMDNHTESQLPTDNPDVLSTFHSILNQNMFFLTSDQVHNLGIPSSSHDDGTVLALGPGETVCFLGAYNFCVLQGSISLCGVTIAASRQAHRVFAPRSSPLPILEGVSGIDMIDGLKQKLPEQFFSVIGAHVTLVLLQKLRTGVQGLGRVCRTFNCVFEPSRWQNNAVLGPSLQIAGVHTMTYQTKDVQAFKLPPSWETALSSIPTEPQDSASNSGGVYLVTGPKKSGKSTFARTLVNKLLTQYQRVAFLECDPGQSEFTPGGMVALNVVRNPIFGPPFTHPTLPVTAHYIGATSPRSSPSHYLAAVQATLEAYRLDVQVPLPNFSPSDEDGDDVDDEGRIRDFIPLVINTMGWTKGLGADLNKKIEDMAQPTDVYEIESDSSTFESQSWPPFTNSTNNSYPYPDSGRDMKSHLLTAIPPSVLSANYTAADHRTLSILSYFYAVFPSPSHFTPHIQADTPLSLALSNPNLTALTWDTTLPLLARPPYEVDSRVFHSLFLSGAGSEDVVPTEVGMVLNAAVVGLVACHFDSELGLGAASDETKNMGISYIQGRAPPSPAMSNCLGIALIRSTSASLSEGSSPGPLPSNPQTKLQMHILTPLPVPCLEQAKVVVKGEMELPVWGWLDHRVEMVDGVAGLEQGKVPYLQFGKGPEGAVGGERRRVRRNLMRRGQM